MRTLFIILISVVLAGCSNNCNYEAIDGEEFVLGETHPIYAKSAYMNIRLGPDIFGENLPYNKYVNMKGKLTNDFYRGSIFNYRKGILSNCEEVYFSILTSKNVEDPKSIETPTVYLLSTKKEAESYIGKSIWIKAPMGQANFIKEDGTRITLNPGQELKIENVIIEPYSSTIKWVAKTKSEEKIVIPFNKDLFYSTKPTEAQLTEDKTSGNNISQVG